MHHAFKLNLLFIHLDTSCIQALPVSFLLHLPGHCTGRTHPGLHFSCQEKLHKRQMISLCSMHIVCILQVHDYFSSDSPPNTFNNCCAYWSIVSLNCIAFLLTPEVITFINSSSQLLSNQLTLLRPFSFNTRTTL